MAVTLAEIDDRVSMAAQLQQNEETGQVTLVNTFTVQPEASDGFLEAWAADAAYMKQQPGYVSAQLYQGIAGSSTFVNIAVWESAQALRAAFFSPEFQAHMGRYPDGTVARPHLFQNVAVPGISEA